jgi:hypothetical protein
MIDVLKLIACILASLFKSRARCNIEPFEISGSSRMEMLAPTWQTSVRAPAV